VTAASNAVDRADDPTRRSEWGFAGLTLVLGAWLIGVVIVAVRGMVTIQQAGDLLNLGQVVLAAVCAAVVARAVRRGRPWRRPFPVGYGVLGAGVLVLVAGQVADLGWREGVADPTGIEGLLAPTRVLFVIGLVLVACGPLRAASRSAGAPRWPAVLSAALVLSAILLPGGFSPAANPWLERAPASLIATGELWLMDGDGSRQTRLVTSNGRDGPSNASYSPDGTKIAYTQIRIGDQSPLDDDYDIWVVDADGTNSRPLIQRPGFQWLPHWSPDGIWIIYTDEPVGGPWMGSGPPVEGGGGLIGPGFLFGRAAQVRQYAHIWRVQADGTGSPEQITNEAADDRAATYSPDGTRLAFDSTRDGPTRVWVMDADGRNARRLTGGADDWGATWSPDGQWIAYKSWLGPLAPLEQIWVIRPDGGTPRQVTSSPASAREPSWSPDGSRIVFTVVEDDRQSIWSIGADGRDPLGLLDDSRAGGELISGGGAWGKDGRIVFTHSDDPPAFADPLVREDLAVAAMLLTALLVALVSVVTVRIGPPFGAFAAILGLSTLAAAAISEQWRFVPAAVVGGLIVDVLVGISPERWKRVAAGAGSAAALVTGSAATVALTSGLGWSPTLIGGVTVAGVLLGCLLAELVATSGPTGQAT
jgi:Tol biopolymer transport system component